MESQYSTYPAPINPSFRYHENIVGWIGLVMEAGMAKKTSAMGEPGGKSPHHVSACSCTVFKSRWEWQAGVAP